MISPQNVAYNIEYLIKTPSGFKPFSAIKKTSSRSVVELTLSSGKVIKGSEDHVLLDMFNFPRKLKEFKIGNSLTLDECIVGKVTYYGKFDLYTVQGVSGEVFLVENSIRSKNCAFIPNNIFNEFYSSVYPTIASGKETQIIMVSSAKDLNHFYDLWVSAKKNENTFAPFEVDWQSVPGRDEEWVRNTKLDIGEARFNREFKNEFFGFVDSVIPSELIKHLQTMSPLYQTLEYKVFEEPKPKEIYIGVVDVAEGVQEDYSVMTIFKMGKIVDSIQQPHTVVFTLRTNKTNIFQFTELVWRFAKTYNEAWILVEVNIHDIATPLYRDYEYENVIKTSLKKQKVTSAFFREGSKFGVKTTTPVKKLGLEMLIDLLKKNWIIINDIEIVKEMSTLVNKKKSFEASPGQHDDLVMTLVLFAWLLTNEGFKELVDIETPRSLLQDAYVNSLWDSLPRFFIEDGINQNLI